MTARKQALARLRARPEDVEPDRPYQVGPFRPEDAEGVAALFYAVYGEAYPLDLYYLPDEIRRAVACGDLHPAVARLDEGAVVGFMALYRSSPPFPGLLELGLGAVHPAYRGSFLLFHLSNQALDLLEGLPQVEALFGEAVCDTVITQHSAFLFGFRETALELGLMPEKTPGEGRTSCLVLVRNGKDRRRKLHVPEAWAGVLADLAEYAGLDREVVPVPPDAASPGPSLLKTEVFASAGVARLHASRLGEDAGKVLDEAEGRGCEAGCRVFQAFLNAGDPGTAAAADMLRRRGYGPGGLIPRWFDDDALLLQKLLDPVDPWRIRLFSDRARSLLAQALDG